LKSRERTATIDAFTNAIDKDTGLRKQKNSIQILIGTTRLIGTGLQLTRAANLVLMEPDYEFYRELQAVARVHRIGQRNLRSYSFRLIDEGSEIESRIVKRQEQRGEVHGREVQTRVLSEVIAEKQQAVMSSEQGLMPVDDEVREEWTREHNELLE
jgi:SNF2 family DNA or RNA helicase